MMEFAGKIHAFVQNAAAVFQKSDKKSKCPRCKGSGLLREQSFWYWKQPEPSNDPCWFCEGIGVMPIMGLDGFMLARASSNLRTRDIKCRSLPTNVQLHSGAPCKLKKYKLPEKDENLWHNSCSVSSHIDSSGPHKLIVGGCARSTSSLQCPLRNVKTFRMRRRERNKVREKAEREALLRSQRIRAPLTATRQQGCVRSEWTSEYSWLDQIIFGSLKDCNSLPPVPVKAL